MDSNFAGRRVNLAGLAVGILMIFLGTMFLLGQVVGQVLHIDLGRVLWPFFVLVPGAVLLALACLLDTEFSEPLSVLGGMATMSGLILLFQNVTGMWASWAYAWALTVPGGAGLGLTLFGLLHGRPDKVHAGTRLLVVACGIFVAGAIFFELILGVNGLGLGRFGWPLLLVGLGIFILLRNLLSRPSDL